MDDKIVLNDRLLFAEEAAISEEEICDTWKLLIVDDEEEVHRITKMSMQDFTFEGRGIEFISAYSGAEAKKMLQENLDTAVVLLDIFMESDSAGLDVIRHLRDTLSNHFARIILRTGKSDQLSEKELISEYDINDYKEKTELTVQKLTSTIISALRSYNELHVIDSNRKDQIVRFHTVFYSSATAMSIISATGELLKVNPRLTALTGYSEEEMLQMTELDITNPEERDATREMFDNLLADRISFVEYEKRYLKKNGSDLWGHVTVSSVRDANSKLLYFVTQMQDITKRKEDQEALKKANLELAAFAHSVAHDLRNPLTPIIVYSNMIQENYKAQLDKNGHRMLGIINSQAQKILSMIEELLMLAQKGVLACPAQALESSDVVSEIIEELSEMIAESGVVIITKHLPVVRTPRSILSQMLGNLIGNAIKYAGKDGSPIEIFGERHGERVRFVVKDHGVGIPVEERDNIFKLYYRGGSYEHVNGTGVGLATVLRIAQMYDGNVWVEETPGGGCTFIM